MTIHIEAFTFETIIGILPSEREEKQRIIIDLKAEYPYRKETFIDYAVLADTVRKHMEEKAFMLLEEALLSLEREIHADYPHITLLYLKITKPDILKHCSVALSREWRY